MAERRGAEGNINLLRERAFLRMQECKYTALVDPRTKSKAEQEEAKANEVTGRDIEQAREDLNKKAFTSYSFVLSFTTRLTLLGAKKRRSAWQVSVTTTSEAAASRWDTLL
ncbi:hypothetical protein CF335_g5117 [Tilletia laevis]|nr:hypothetical protein CF335_g5117 [Tilletia laevis]